MKFFYPLFSLLLFSLLSFAQAPPESGFGGFHSVSPGIHDEIPQPQRQQIYNMIRTGIKDLAKKGITAESSLRRSPQAIKFNHPLRQAAGFNDPGYYGISGYIDQDNTNGVKDFNCGSRTYNGHMGTDFFTFPFWWKKMEENAVEIVAAADGIIVAKSVTRDDKVCANCPDDAPEACFYWNCVYLQHADGTLSMYGHMKKNSPTTKNVGDAVAQGEYLGIVGSSGNSSGPHLHFEVWTDTTFTTLLDPWAGSCNPTIPASLWQQQEAYYAPSIAKVMTGSAIPEVKECYDGTVEKTYEKKEFTIGETVYLTTFVRDHRGTGSNYIVTITGPGTIKYTWTLAANSWSGHYTWLYFYYFYDQAVFNVPGAWNFSVQYGANTYSTAFTMKSALPLNLLSFAGKEVDGNVSLNWQTTAEINTDYFEIEHGVDAQHMKAVGKVATTGNDRKGNSNYSFRHENPEQGMNFYRLKMVDIDGKFKYSDIIKVNFESQVAVQMFPNPATRFVELKNVSSFDFVSIVNVNGLRVLHQTLQGNEVKIDVSRLPQGVYVVQLNNNNKQIRKKLVINK